MTYGPTATEIMHNLSTAVIDPEGKLATLLVGSGAKSWTPPDLLKVIYPLVKAADKRPDRLPAVFAPHDLSAAVLPQSPREPGRAAWAGAKWGPGAGTRTRASL